jgi:ribulose 1,5-bisphosphate carboxylase large subunit-like protein
MGLSVEAMREINAHVLRGGFDAVKDDELTPAGPDADYRRRIGMLAAGAREAEQQTGEGKLFFANVIGDLPASMAQIEIARDCGADGVIIAPAIQGLAAAQWFIRHTDLPLLAHNTVDDVFTRSPRFGVSPAVYLTLLRVSGADLLFLPGNFGSGTEDRGEIAAAVSACLAPLAHVRPCLPIIAGGKRPERMGDYLAQIGSPDFMVIAASAVDEHPAGPLAGARAFRDALKVL